MSDLEDSCLTKEQKKLVDELSEVGISMLSDDDPKIKEYEELVEQINICKHVSSTSEKKVKRKPSKYNIFIGDCMRGGGKGMKECAADYREANPK